MTEDDAATIISLLETISEHIKKLNDQAGFNKRITRRYTRGIKGYKKEKITYPESPRSKRKWNGANYAIDKRQRSL